MIVLDTSLLVDALTGDRRSEGALRRTIAHGERLRITALVLYEWLRGPRAGEEVAAQEGLFPADAVLAFGAGEAEIAARLFRVVPRARARQFDLGIAASVLRHDAMLWTLNPQDFDDIPELKLYTAPASRPEDRP